MKLLLTTILFLIGASSFAQADTTKPEKVYQIKLTESEVNALYSTLQFSRAALPTSEAPAKSVTQAIQVITSMEAIIVKQYQAQNPKK